MLSINTNLSSLIAQGSMKSSTNKLNQAIERMTTGFKINHAKDNAANYSIATNMTTKIGAYNVAEDNAAMGLDLISTAEGTLSQIEDKLQRLRALAEQASNGTYGEQSLNAINAEANALIDEINRLYSTAEYNGLKLFGGSTELEADEAAPISTFALARAVNETNTFIQEVVKRDTSGMTKLEDVAASSTLAQGTYSISTAEGLAKLATMQNQGLITAGSEFVLASNIDLSAYSTGEGWIPIGTNSNPFRSNFDGNGYIISNLCINRANTDYQGLFGCGSYTFTEDPARLTIYNINNLGLEDVNIVGKDYVGGILGNSNFNLSNCFVTGSIVGENYVGSIAGKSAGVMSEGNFKKVYSAANISGIIAGGLFGALTDGNIVSSCFTGSVDGSSSTGGLIGASDSNWSATYITSSYSTGVVTGTGYLGGLVGNKEGYLILESAYWNIESSGLSVGIGSGEPDSGTVLGVTNAELEELINSGALPKADWVSSDPDDVPEPEPGGDSGSEPEGGSPDNGEDSVPEVPDIGGGTTVIPTPALPTGIGSYAPEIVCIQIGTGSASHSQVSFNIKFSIDGLEELRNIGLSTSSAALYGLRSNVNPKGNIARCDELLSEISEKLTHFGATSNRLESVLEEITIQRDNLVSSRSTIRDADIAEVSSHYIQQQILQQASATLLATANQSPSIALQLI